MILTTTCNAEEFEAIRAAAIRHGIQVTAAPGFIYRKGNWIVGGTQETESHFNERIPSESLTPREFLEMIRHKSEEPIRSMFIICEDMTQRDQVWGYFISKGYKGMEVMVADGLAVCVIPAERTLMITFKYVARQNAKEGYTIIDFETFKTIVG